MASPSALLARVRERRPALDHAVRAAGRYQADGGDRQAAAVTFFGFLSFFPLLAVAASLLALFLGEDAVARVVQQVDSYAPGLAEKLELRKILTQNTKAGITGLLGLVALLYSGLAWVDALRQAIRGIWHHNVKEGSFLVKKLMDVLILAGLGLTLVVSVGVSAATGAFTDFALDLVDLERTVAAVALTKALGILLGLLTSTGLFLFLFVRLPKVQFPFHRVLRGAVLAAVLFELLKRVGAFYIDRTTENPLYGAFAVIVGLLVWINIVSRMLLLCAAWVVTAPYDSDVEPSGTANAAVARQAGILPDLADDDPGNLPTMLRDGAPIPLLTAVPGQAHRPDGPEQPVALPADPSTPAAPVGEGAPVPPQRKAEQVVRQAAQFTAGALGMVVTAVLIHVLRTLREVLRR